MARQWCHLLVQIKLDRACTTTTLYSFTKTSKITSKVKGYGVKGWVNSLYSFVGLLSVVLNRSPRGPRPSLQAHASRSPCQSLGNAVNGKNTETIDRHREVVAEPLCKCISEGLMHVAACLSVCLSVCLCLFICVCGYVFCVL